jgi:pre-mRNA-processing factor 39
MHQCDHHNILLLTQLLGGRGCRIYERGVAYVGTDYNAHGLWDKYLAYEGYAGSSQQVAALYTRLLACPIKELDRYYTR